MTFVNPHERQVATTLDGIRGDHRFRYEWAVDRINGKRVIDAACGVGYGSTILADAGFEVQAVDRDGPAIEYAKQHWNHNPNITYNQIDLYSLESTDECDAVVAFEVLEHLVDPGLVLRKFNGMAPRLLCSVPNEVGFPFKGYAYHVRHYTQGDFEVLLRENGWNVVEWWGQEDAISSPVPGLKDGRTIVAVCDRIDGFEAKVEEDISLITPEEILGRPVPESVAIVAMGNSRDLFFQECITNWGTPEAEEVWAINAIGGLIQWDRLFHMDDLAIQHARSEGEHKAIGNMLKWMKEKPQGPVYTSRIKGDLYEQYPTLVEYPIEWVLNRNGGHVYHNNTTVYALTFALALRVPHIQLYGCDFSYPTLHKREQGRACLEFWLGVAATKGLKIKVAGTSTLMDANSQLPKLYGYDTEWITTQSVNGRVKVSRVDRLPEDIPGAEEMEIRYSHSPELEQTATQDKEK